MRQGRAAQGMVGLGMAGPSHAIPGLA